MIRLISRCCRPALQNHWTLPSACWRRGLSTTQGKAALTHLPPIEPPLPDVAAVRRSQKDVIADSHAEMKDVVVDDKPVATTFTEIDNGKANDLVMTKRKRGSKP